MPALGFAALAGCASNAPQDSWDPAGPNSQMIHNLQWPVFAIAGLILVIVCVAVVFIVIRYRDRGQAIPEQTHGKPALEIGLTILPALILIGIAIPTVRTIFALEEDHDTECVVNVTGQQWWWELSYPTQDGCGGVEQPIVTSGQMVIPAGMPVMISGTSNDVIHSWWVPRLNGKRDIVPGRVHTLRMEADEPGIYAGQCAEFCGLSHANMRMEVVALDPDDFATWKQMQTASYDERRPEEGSLAAEGEALFVQQCARCHQIEGLSEVEDPETGEPAYGSAAVANPEVNVYAGNAPDLTNFASRNTFAGATFDLLTPACREDVWEAPPEEFGERYLAGVERGCLNEVELREWLRDAPAKKPMYTDAEQLDDTRGLPRGMPDLGLAEEQIDQLIAYLLERK